MKRITAIVLFITASCNTTKHISNEPGLPRNIAVNAKVFTSLYQQKSAEYRALCFQAFNLAKIRLDESVTQGGKPKAIITDLDETILDNSPYEVHQTLQGKDYDAQSWSQWIAMGKADTVPGSATFLHYAATRGVTIFYISNREEKDRVGTLLNLQNLHLPNADNAHLLLKQGVSSKEPRRLQVAASYDVLLLLGDNLIDFSPVFEKKPVNEREQTTNSMSAEFGKRFIVIPNPVYGDWESALYKYSNTLTASQKDSIIKNSLKSY